MGIRQEPKVTITHCGKSINTSLIKEFTLTDEKFKEVVNLFYQKPEIKDVYECLWGIENGKSVITEMVNYYVRDLMAKVKIFRCPWSVSQVMESKELVELFLTKIDRNKKLFNPEFGLAHNLDLVFKIGGVNIAYMPANFPIKTVDLILRKYNMNGKYYDFSCGWGTRMLGAMRNGVEYYGTDPNTELVERLRACHDDYEKAVNKKKVVKIYCQGSEDFIPELEGKIGVAFSSPPYFDLEDYVIGEKQSYKPGMSYDAWLESFVRPTVKNIYRYLIKDGYFCINVKDFDGHALEADCRRIAEEEGFEFVRHEFVVRPKRPSGVKETELTYEAWLTKFNDNTEKTAVFCKQGSAKKTIGQLALF